MYKRGGEDDLSIQKIMGAQFEFANDINTARKETSIESNEKDFSSILESKSKKCPYSMLARDGIIEYNGVIFSCDFDNNRISLGDMSDPKKVLNISLPSGGTLRLNVDNFGDIAKASSMFCPEDLNAIMRAIHQYNYCQKKLNEIDEEENNILDEVKIKNEQQ